MQLHSMHGHLLRVGGVLQKELRKVRNCERTPVEDTGEASES